MAYFPFFIDIKGANGLMIGGGKHALGKIEKLLPYEPNLHVITTEISEEVREITKENEILCAQVRSGHRPGDCGRDVCKDKMMKENDACQRENDMFILICLSA